MFNKINLIFFLPNFSLGGAGNSITRLCSSLNQTNYNIFLISLGKNFYKDIFKHKKNIHFIEIKSSKVIFAFFQIKKIVKNIIFNYKSKKTIFLSNIHYANIISILALRKIENVKIILIERTSIEELRIYNNFIELFKKKIILFLVIHLYKFSDKIIANSKFVSNDLSKLIKKKVLTIHPPSIKKIYPARAKNIKFNNFKIIFIGRLSKEKGIELIIKSLALLKKKRFILKIVGDGSDIKKLKILTNRLGLERKIFFLGKKVNVKKYYINADLFINASYFEGLPNSIVEAINYNVPCICSNSKGGTKEVLLNGRGGDFFKVGNYVDLSKKINKFFENPKKLINKIKIARKNLKNFRYDVSNKSYEKLFLQI